MNTNFNHSILKDHMHVFVDPTVTNEPRPKFNVSWSINYYEGRRMEIQLLFDKNASISPYKIQDKLFVQITNASLFYSPVVGVNLHQDSFIMSHNLRPQSKDILLQQKINESSIIGKYTIEVNFIIACIINLVFARGVIHMTDMMRGLQVMVHLPIF